MHWGNKLVRMVQVTKPVIAWVSGTCAKLFKSEVQFGHAGAKSGGDMESAQVCRAAAYVHPAAACMQTWCSYSTRTGRSCGN